jgi:hypothetical protein
MCDRFFEWVGVCDWSRQKWSYSDVRRLSAPGRVRSPSVSAISQSQYAIGDDLAQEEKDGCRVHSNPILPGRSAR